MYVFTSSYSQNKHDVYRKGFVFGTAIGISHSVQNFQSNNKNNTGLGLDFKLGYMLRPNLALLLSSNVSSYDYSGLGRNRKRDFGIVAPTLQYWLSDRFWILGGVGLGVDAPIFWDIEKPEINKEEAKYYAGLGVVTALGFEIYRKKNFALDIKTRLTYRNVKLQEGRTSGFSPALLLGVNFY
jgi:hypothetical protein